MRRARIVAWIVALIGMALIFPFERSTDLVETEGGNYLHNYVVAYGYSLSYTLGPEGVTHWRVVIPSCCGDWTPGGWAGWSPTAFADYGMFPDESGEWDELLLTIRLPGSVVPDGYVWSGTLVGWSSDSGWFQNMDTVEWPWQR